MPCAAVSERNLAVHVQGNDELFSCPIICLTTHAFVRFPLFLLFSLFLLFQLFHSLPFIHLLGEIRQFYCFFLLRHISLFSFFAKIRHSFHIPNKSFAKNLSVPVVTAKMVPLRCSATVLQFKNKGWESQKKFLYLYI